MVIASALTGASAGSAHAFAHFGAPYPYEGFTYEGKWPSQTPCKRKWRVVPGRDTNILYNGTTWIRLRHFYSAKCGSYARIDNAPSGECGVALYRTTLASLTHDTPFSMIVEPVDPGIDFAYTPVGDNLDGRYAWTAIICRGKVIHQTKAY